MKKQLLYLLFLIVLFFAERIIFKNIACSYFTIEPFFSRVVSYLLIFLVTFSAIVIYNKYRFINVKKYRFIIMFILLCFVLYRTIIMINSINIVNATCDKILVNDGLNLKTESLTLSEFNLLKEGKLLNNVKLKDEATNIIVELYCDRLLDDYEIKINYNLPLGLEFIESEVEDQGKSFHHSIVDTINDQLSIEYYATKW